MFLCVWVCAYDCSMNEIEWNEISLLCFTIARVIILRSNSWVPSLCRMSVSVRCTRTQKPNVIRWKSTTNITTSSPNWRQQIYPFHQHNNDNNNNKKSLKAEIWLRFMRGHFHFFFVHSFRCCIHKHIHMSHDVRFKTKAKEMQKTKNEQKRKTLKKQIKRLNNLEVIRVRIYWLMRAAVCHTTQYTVNLLWAHGWQSQTGLYCYIVYRNGVVFILIYIYCSCLKRNFPYQ